MIKQKLEIEEIKVELKKKQKKRKIGIQKGSIHGTGGSGAPPANYIDEPAARLKISKEDVQPVAKQKEEKPKITERNFYQRHKFGVILTAVLVVLTLIGFGVGFSIEKKSPKTLPPQEPTLNQTTI